MCVFGSLFKALKAEQCKFNVKYSNTEASQ